MFSKSCEYAIKAMIYIANNTKNSSTGKVGTKQIAKGIEAPENFIAKILQDLSKRKLLHSAKGPNGGFYLTEEEKQRTLTDIIKAIDGDGFYLNCLLGLKVCSEKTPCPVHHQYKEVKQKLVYILDNNTIGQLNEKIESGKFFLKNIGL